MANRLFDALDLGAMTLPNRIVMPPMMRARATAEHFATELMATYYSQRAEAGLIIAEGTGPTPGGMGYARMPGLSSQAQAEAWRQVVDAVHQRGGRIFVQLMHCGRVAHPLNMPAGTQVVAPSAIAVADSMWTDQEQMQPPPVPVAMTEEMILHTIEAYADSAEMAIAVGFDGVEIHGANGYLVDQFLNTASNQRDDQWGGSVENRARFAIEIAKAVTARIGAERTGIRFSPYGAFNGMTADAEMDALYTHLATACSDMGLLYIHLVDLSSWGMPEVPTETKGKIRESFNGCLILSGGYDAERAEADLARNACDLVAFGRPYIANPDLVQRLKQGLPLNTADEETFYSPGEKGYTDYPLAVVG